MSLVKNLILSALLAATNSKKVKFGVMTDIHLNPNYKPNIIGEQNQYCIGDIVAD